MVLEGESILCVAPEPWQSMWRSRQQIMSRLAARNKVLFIEPAGHLKATARRFFRGEVGFKEAICPRTVEIRSHLHTYRSPALAPVSGRFPLGNLTKLARALAQGQAMNRLGLRDPIIWIERPDQWDHVDKRGASLTIYRVTDEYTAFPGMSGQAKLRTRELERAALARADLVLVASEELLAAKSIHNPDTYLLPHGVDTAAFFEASHSDALVPHDISHARRPVIGYSGLISARLDFELLREVAKVFSDCTLAMVGEVNPLCCVQQIEALKNLRNVLFLGGKPASAVPKYVKAFDVCLIPYGINEESRYANPLKLLEYLAAGKPVVAVNIPAVRPFVEVVRVAAGARPFLEQVRLALEDDDGTAAARRTEVAAAHSWDRVVERFSDLVLTGIERKESQG